MKPIIDTNILIDYLNGIPEARTELEKYPKAGISVVTWAEIMVGSKDGEERPLRSFLRRFEVFPLTLEVADIAWRLRRDYRMRLPDAAIWAAAKHVGTLLVTRDTNAFPEDEPGIRIPYRLDPKAGIRPFLDK